MSDEHQLLDEEGAERPLAIPSELPVLPLRDTVLFPNSFMPLAVARESSVRLIEEAIADSRLVGVLSEKDCLHTVVHGAYNNVPMGMVADYMSTNVMTITPELDVMAVASDFLKQVYRRFPVVDEEGRLVGQLTRRDLLRAIHTIMGEDWSAEQQVGS